MPLITAAVMPANNPAIRDCFKFNFEVIVLCFNCFSKLHLPELQVMLVNQL
jgi:hypothetical protein